MLRTSVHIAILTLQLSQLAAATVPLNRSAAPTIKLDDGIFIGLNTGATNEFLGIPFAKPPVGDLRLRLPQANEPYHGIFNATVFGNRCISQDLTANIPSDTMNPTAVSVLSAVLQRFNSNEVESEDCLFVNVVVPANATGESKLPVVFWIYGSGFESGTSSAYNGSAVVQRSLELDTPVIYVSLNHRCVLSLGFPGGKEAKEAGIGNLGLRDQRLAMRWVQKYISTFGGDPAKVMIWGESAGASAVEMHMLANGGDNQGLFRSAFMHSVAVFPDDYSMDIGQAVFDQFVSDAGCADALGSVVVFDCLRALPIDAIRNATTPTPGVFGYTSLSIGWRPYADGVFVTTSPTQLVLDGSITDIPYVIGNAEDEATMFVLSATNITTDEELQAYLSDNAFAAFSMTGIDRILGLYSSDPTAGSPFDTGDANAITPEYKRMAAVLGDAFLQAPRRFLLRQRSGQQPSYAYLYSRFKSTPYLGAFHTSDDADIYGPGDLTDAIVRFAATLDPNGVLNVTWPRYTPDAPQMFRFLDGDVPFEVINDTFRENGIDALIELEAEVA
ncbi:carotenoid ester lipase precursor [Vararia minispora EC-137]|uniref:Carotenoid ester lipase n=1 Tax=Vararia minispora EC-137 TaxID=1314806 RepID=A0ACB8QA68_9AGAM|nr:carotenoid ester lipase precursor [Vararia minispora EC-137]